MTPIITDGNQNQTREFRTFTASTKVTEVELNELEQAAAACDVRLGEWVREVLLREAKSSSKTIAIGPSHDRNRRLATVPDQRSFARCVR